MNMDAALNEFCVQALLVDGVSGVEKDVLRRM